ncbi:MAG: hypothetical protein JXR62_07340 [Bacilli bacterium]|nr:hypothetical protein [Bacilli bacterium]
MQKLKRIYLILAYMFFIYPPFIAGLVFIYNETGDNVETISLFVNILVLLVLTGVISLFIANKKLHIPTKEEIKYLIFGLVGNIVMYFYTFQNNLNLENIVTIYLVLLIVMGVHYALISKKFQPLELWILLPIFLVYDYLYLILTGCGYSNQYNCYQSTSSYPFLVPLFFIIVAFIMLYYIYRIVLYKLIDLFKIINIVLSVILSFIAFNDFTANEKFTLTVAILLPFFIIVDFIVSIVNKTFKKQMILFYIRTITLIFISIFIGASGILNGYDFDVESLAVFVVITYVSLFISILKTIMNITIVETKITDLFLPNSSSVKYLSCTSDELAQIENFFLHYKGDTITSIDDYNLQVKKDTNVIGVVRATTTLLEINPNLMQANIYFLKVIEDIEQHSTELINRVERHYKSSGVTYLTYQANIHEKEIIEVLLKRGYSPVKTETSAYTFIKILS